jgi:starch synthase
MTLRVLSVASEVFPLVKTGGLADVAGALPAALKPLGVEIATLLPGYPVVMARLRGPQPVHAWTDLFGGPARLIAGAEGGLDLFVLDAPHLYARAGNPYLGPDGRDWPDNAFRFAALSYVAAELGSGRAGAYVADIIHGHDWHAGLIPAYLKFGGAGRSPATVATIHNLAFQGLFAADLLQRLKLPPEAFRVEGVEYYGKIGFLKGALALADAITTVSPTYAREIQTPELGMGLDGVLRYRADRLTGIVNGIDAEIWNPATDPHLTARYAANTLQARDANKAAIRARFKLGDGNGPLVAVVSRLTAQKGIDLLLPLLPELVRQGCQFALLGSGEPAIEQGLLAAAGQYPKEIGVALGYDESLSHLLQGGADVILVPSRFEPCGLTQLYGLRYGTLPLVARTGGLADTVADGATGFQFSPVTGDALMATFRRALHVFAEPAAWQNMQREALAQDVSWARPAQDYARVYRALAGKEQAIPKAAASPV